LCVVASATWFHCSLAFAGEEHQSVKIPSLLMLPFILLLAAIAIVPFLAPQWWKRNYPYVAVALGAIPVAYYIFAMDGIAKVVHTEMEYVSFIVLIGSLFVIAGSIHLKIKGRATPLKNVLLLAIGAVAANILGTTGASMLLIRPYLRLNRDRLRGFHVVFFIFIVSNIGGALIPLGPPLFLGFLKGVPFWWVFENAWQMWTVTLVILLAVFFALDAISSRSFDAGRDHPPQPKFPGEEQAGGMHNLFFLLIVVAAVFLEKPPLLREAVMILAATGAYFTTRNEIHAKNDFNFAPMKEVAILFAGIFATMLPALDWLEVNARSTGITTAGQFYWGTGILSAVLDNAPAYLNFLSASFGLFVDHHIVAQVQQLVSAHGSIIGSAGGVVPDDITRTYAALTACRPEYVARGSVPVADIQMAYIIANQSIHLKAISMGAVFFGACTYIGNGPNFMVKSIAEQTGVEMPSFFGYIARYTLPVLIPTLGLIWYLFFTS